MLLNKLLLSAILLASPTFLLAKPPVAELEAKSGTTVVRIKGDKCSNKKVLDIIDPKFHSIFKSAEIKFGEKKLRACWTPDQGAIFLMDEEGNSGYVPLEAFKPSESI